MPNSRTSSRTASRWFAASSILLVIGFIVVLAAGILHQGQPERSELLNLSILIGIIGVVSFIAWVATYSAWEEIKKGDLIASITEARAETSRLGNRLGEARAEASTARSEKYEAQFERDEMAEERDALRAQLDVRPAGGITIQLLAPAGLKPKAARALAAAMGDQLAHYLGTELKIDGANAVFNGEGSPAALAAFARDLAEIENRPEF